MIHSDGIGSCSRFPVFDAFSAANSFTLRRKTLCAPGGGLASSLALLVAGQAPAREALAARVVPVVRIGVFRRRRTQARGTVDNPRMMPEVMFGMQVGFGLGIGGNGG